MSISLTKSLLDEANTDLSGAVIEFPLPGFDNTKQHRLTLSLRDNKAFCFVDGVKIIQKTLGLYEYRGTYGFDTYGPQGSESIIRSLDVSPNL